MVIDTMVLAYALLGVSEKREEAAEALGRPVEIRVPDSVWPELLSVAWQWVRADQATMQDGLNLLRDAQALITEQVACELLWETALRLGLERDHSPYDTLFVALAVHRKTKVLTYDRRLLTTFPEHAIAPDAFLANPD